ncbi:hypothetical protein ZOSMA_23G00540 [Zostera marina]|uniref:Uncharacterized protein n=1 Tax=Zostera marina TaxID=29655 RepID=A0A0K9PHG2_ZOSMR|nr:hypothetical protein ZOSMA_23G00540 [Zostera marina]
MLKVNDELFPGNQRFSIKAGADRALKARAKKFIGSILRLSDSHEVRHRLLPLLDSVSVDGKLLDIVISFLLAGRDTVSSEITSFFFLLSKYLEVEVAIIVEIHTNMVNEDNHIREDLEREAVPGVPTYNHLRQLHYIHAVHETPLTGFCPLIVEMTVS